MQANDTTLETPDQTMDNQVPNSQIGNVNDKVSYGTLQNDNPKSQNDLLEEQDYQKMDVKESDTLLDNDEATEAELRVGFIRKVYGILLTQLFITFGFVIIVKQDDELNRSIRDDYTWIWTCLVVNLITIFTLYCVRSLSRKVPVNYILLGIFTITETYMLGKLCSYFPESCVLTTLGMTVGLVVSLTGYAFYTKTDFTMCGGLLFACCGILFIMGIFQFIYDDNSTFFYIFSSLSLLLFSIYLIYDTQLLIGKNHHARVSMDDYILGAVMLYIDIVMIFVHLLKMLGRAL